jgi:hypothetical protein
MCLSFSDPAHLFPEAGGQVPSSLVGALAGGRRDVQAPASAFHFR